MPNASIAYLSMFLAQHSGTSGTFSADTPSPFRTIAIVSPSHSRSFGFTNLTALRDGHRGADCRGEEHHIELIWSVKSGKTRVHWNQQNITKHFREGARSGMVEFSWKSRSGELLQIVAHSETRSGVTHQYDLLVDGVSFFRFPPLSEVGTIPEQLDEERSPENWTESIADVVSDLASGDYLGGQPAPPAENMEFRLSMVGLNSGVEDEVVDELHSDIYSPLLESLRDQIIQCVPQAEEMVSRAIINAFFVDSDSQNSLSTQSSRSLASGSPVQIEAACLWDAYEWVSQNIDCTPRLDAQDQALDVMEKHIESVCVYLRNDMLNANEAARILLGVAAILGLKFINSIPRDTLLLLDIPKGTTEAELQDAVADIGEVQSAIFLESQQFGVVRFAFPMSEDIEKCQSCHPIEIGQESIRSILLSESLDEGFSKKKAPELTIDTEPVPVVVPSGSEDSPVPHLMANLSSCGFDDFFENTYVTPERTAFPSYEDLKGEESALELERKAISPDSVTHVVTPLHSSSPSEVYSHLLH